MNDHPPHMPPSGNAPPSRDSDPDAEGLPPHITLPDRNLYKRSQFRARTVLCVLALIVVGAFWFANRGASIVYPVCFALVTLTLLVTLFRLWRISRLVASERNESQDSFRHD